MAANVSGRTDTKGDRERAQQALEQVCARGDFAAAEAVYSDRFVDHVNDLDFHGKEGIRQSVGLYRRVLSDLRIRVEDQVAESDRVASRWVAEGSNRGRPLRLQGITISRFEDGRIVEDWSTSDNLGLLRQLGPKRALLLAVSELWSRTRSVKGRPT
jgi:predicted ester cyclase